MSDAPSTDDNPALLRDRLVSQASMHFNRSEIPEGMAALAKLEFATIDNATLQRTDRFLHLIAQGRRIVATCDPRRMPAKDEIVIVYGNYPHIFDNVVVNNPIKRHVAFFGEFRYDQVEFDPRWDLVGHIYVINADHRLDRYDSVLRELANARAPLHRITRIAAVRSEETKISLIDGTIGCLRSHIEALRQASSADCEHVLVLEDDFCFTTDMDEHLEHLQRFLYRTYDYLVCLLATSKYGKVVPQDDLVCQSLQECTNAAAFLVSRKGVGRLLEVQEVALRRLIETGDINRYAADRYWSILQDTGKFLVFRKKLGFQTSSFSDVERKISRYFD
jgi:hypothetical protein